MLNYIKNLKIELMLWKDVLFSGDNYKNVFIVNQKKVYPSQLRESTICKYQDRLLDLKRSMLEIQLSLSTSLIPYKSPLYIELIKLNLQIAIFEKVISATSHKP